jgi:signal transduction histidine kinase
MNINLSKQYGVPVTSLKKLLNFRHTVAFRLTVLYAGVFTISLFVVSITFYVFVLYGSHDLTREALSSIREDFREYFVWPIASVVVFSALVGWFMSQRALSGIRELTSTAVAVANGALKERVPVKGHQDEIDQLAVAFNSMLERIEALIVGMKGTNDNIAHDLRSPIARMRGMAEAKLIDKASNKDSQALAGYIVEECDRLLGMINTMLDISEAEAGVMKLNIEQIDIVPIVRDAVELFRPLAESRDIALEMQTPDLFYLDCDKRKLQRIIGNLLDNAFKFSHSSGSIAVSVRIDHKYVVIEVRDRGIGIPEEDLPHIFDRFFRGEKSRTEPGNGLGLSLAKAFVVSLGGSITVTSAPGEGSIFTVLLPRGSFSP